MTKTKQNVHTYRIDKICDVCNRGNLISTGTGNEHRCDNPDCQEITTLAGELYPQFITEAIGAVEIISE